MTAASSLSRTAASTARRCLREYWYRYEFGARPLSRGLAMRMGAVIHRALDAWWRTGPLVGLAVAMAELERVGAEEALSPFDLARARAMLVGYDARWRASGWTAERVEWETEIPVTNPGTRGVSRTFSRRAVLDVVARDQAGDLYVVEHKTTSQDVAPGAPFWQVRALDEQLAVYVDAARAAGLEVRGCLYDVLVKPQQRPLVANKQRPADETPAEFETRLLEAVAADPARFFVRAAVPVLEADLTAARRDAWDLSRLLVYARRRGHFPRNPDACQRFGSLCSYFGVCTGRASIHDETLFALRTATSPDNDVRLLED